MTQHGHATPLGPTPERRGRPRQPPLSAGHRSVRRVLASDWTPEQDDLIRWAYGTRSLADRRARVPVVKAKTGRTNEQCHCRALQLGCTHPLNPRRQFWTLAEDELLEQCAHLSPPAMSKRLKKHGYRRSESAIIKRRQQLGLNYREERRDAGIYTADDAAEVLGVSGPMVCAFIKRGWLKARKTGDASTSAWHIKANDLRAFVIHYTAYVRFDVADKYYLVELLCPNQGVKSPGQDVMAGTAGEDDTVAKPLSLGAYT